MSKNSRDTYSSYRTCCLLAALIVALAFSTTAHAQLSDDSQELMLNVSFFHQNDTDSGTITGDGSYGYFLSDTFEVGFRQAISSTLIEDQSDVWIATTSPFLRYNFNYDRDQTVIPFVGAFIGGVWNDDDATGTLGPEIGVRFFAGENIFFMTQYRYEWFFEDLELDNDTIDDDFETITDNSSRGNHVATIGFGYAF